jgi:hypothetical protein
MTDLLLSSIETPPIVTLRRSDVQVSDRIGAVFAALAHVRFWHKADITRLSSDVCSWG